jgi:hypothetical protein
MFSGVLGEVLFFIGLFLIGLFGVALTLAGLASASLAPAGLTFGPESLSPDQEVETRLSTWIFFASSLVLLATGMTGVVYRIMRIGASNERRAALSRRVPLSRRNAGDNLKANDHLAESLISARPGGNGGLPNVPRGYDLNDSPGVRMTYRLPAFGSPVATVAAAALLALLWCGTWVVLAAVAVSGFWWGSPRPVLTFLLLPLGAIGLWTARYFFRLLRESAGVGATIVEVSDIPLVPGGQYQIYVAQYGRLKLRKMLVQLICEEESIFRQGTDVRIDRHVAHDTVVFADKNVSIDSGTPWEQEFAIIVPMGAMHSFQSPHNAVSWKIVVIGESRPWPSFCRSFPVVVHPPHATPNRDQR